MLPVTIAAVLLGFAAPDAVPEQWSCTGSATASDGAEVLVTFTVEADGTLIYRSASWTPPRRAGASAGGGLFGDAPTLAIDYDEITETDLGPATGVLATAASFADPALLKGSTATLTLDGDRRWVGAMEPFPTANSGWFLSVFPGTGAETPGTALSSDDLLEAVGTAHVAHAVLQGPNDHELGWTSYDLSARNERDRLFRKAFRTAERAAAHPRQCERTGADAGGVGLEPIGTRWPITTRASP